MQLKNFQEEAITALKETFYKLWRGGNRRASLVFKAPTGAGKTIMAAEFLRRISGDMQFDADKAFIWVSFNEDSYEQSKKSLFDYLNGGVANVNLLDLNHLNNGFLQKNDVFFINWQKIVSQAKENRKLRNDGEANISFDTFVANTHDQGREIILIVDEAHLSKDTALAEDVITMINPRVEIHISATPKYIPNMEEERELKAGFVSVSHEKVVEEGLIKEAVEVMPEEEIIALEMNQERDLDELLLDLAIQKKKELEAEYAKYASQINPLILIQLPNDEKEKDSTEGQSKLDFTKGYLKELGYEESEIAIWLSEKKENLEEITKNNSPINFLIFKQAAATGWDCPRAQVLVMFREIKSPIFKTQVIGRTLRMPEAKHYPVALLNKAYLYTSYRKNDIAITQNKQGANQLAFQKAFLREGVNGITLPSLFIKRGKYNDLGDSFQKTFVKVANDYFGIDHNDILGTAEKKLEAKGLDMKAISITRQLIVNAKIEVYDDFVRELEEEKDTLDHVASYRDTKKLYDLLLYREIANQEEENKKYGPERSWGKLKTAINIWLKEIVKISNPPLYSIVCNDLEKGDTSVLRKVISQSLGEYRPIREQEEQVKIEKSREHLIFELASKYSFTGEYEPVDSKLSVIDPCYFRKEYLGRDNELNFIKFLEKQEIDWWFKNGDLGRENFAVEYTNDDGVSALFYPDFIVRKGNSIGIFDTKSGATAKDAGARARGLRAYIEAYNKGNFKQWGDYTLNQQYTLWGGIVVPNSGLWKLNANSDYSFSSQDLKGWQDLTFKKDH